MTSPALEREAVRLGIIKAPEPVRYPWEAQTLYEPAPLSRITRKRSRVRVVMIIAVVAYLAALWLAHWGGEHILLPAVKAHYAALTGASH